MYSREIYRVKFNDKWHTVELRSHHAIKETYFIIDGLIIRKEDCELYYLIDE